MGVKHSKSLIKKLDERDVAKIKLVFNDLAAPSGGKGIDIDTFKQFSQFSDMVAERAFVLFSTKKPGLIDLEEFIAGLALCYRGSEKDKLKAIYRILAVTTDKVSKDEVSMVLNSAVSAPTWNASTREDLKPPSELVQKLIEMGFPRTQCDKAVEATKSTSVDDAVAWIVANKPDPLTDAHILLASMFEGHTDGFTNWKKFKKWAGGKRPQQFMGFLNGFPALYERAILWSSTPRPLAPPKENLIDFTIDDIKPSAPTPIPIQHTGGKEKRRSHRSLSQLMNRRSMDSVPPPVNTAPALGLGSDSFLSSDIPLNPTVPSLVPTPLNAIQEAPGSAPGTPDMPRLPSNLSTNSSAPTTPTASSFGPSSNSPSPSPSNSTPTTPVGTTPTNALAPPSPQRMRAHSSLGHVTKKATSSSDDDWSSDEDDHELKPAIQVFIKPKGESTSSATAPALAPPTVPALGGPKTGRPSTVGARSRNRPTNKMALQSSFFDPQWAETAAKARNSLADDDDSAPSTPTSSAPSTPSTPSALSAPSTPSVSTTPSTISAPSTPTTAPSTPSTETPTISPPEPQLVKFSSQANLETAPSAPSKPANKVATEHMKAAMAYLEKGNFADSLREVNKSLRSILDVEDPQTVKGEANFCVAYKVALNILLVIRDLEGKLAASANASSPPSPDIPIKMAFLSKILSDIPLKTNHRIVCVRMAISKNMHPQAANYAVAARLVEALLLKGAPDREALQTKLKKCKEDETDSTLPSYTCPSCSAECSSAALKCSCGRPVRWCFKTYELITSEHFLQCSFCNALVSPSDSMKAGDKCEFCEHGLFEEK